MSLFKTKVIAKPDYDHINNVTYLQYLEQARKELYALSNSNGVRSFVVHLQVDYIREVLTKEELTILSRIEKIGNTSYTLAQEIYNENNELVVSASVVLVTVEPKSKQKVRVPDAIRAFALENNHTVHNKS